MVLLALQTWLRIEGPSKGSESLLVPKEKGLSCQGLSFINVNSDFVSSDRFRNWYSIDPPTLRNTLRRAGRRETGTGNSRSVWMTALLRQLQGGRSTRWSGVFLHPTIVTPGNSRSTSNNNEGPSLAFLNLAKAQFSGKDLTNWRLSRTELSHADLRAAKLSRATAEFSRFAGAQLSGADLERAKLDFADLTRADLTRVNFRKAQMRHCKFDGAKVSFAERPFRHRF